MEKLKYEDVVHRAKEFLGSLGLEIAFTYYFGIAPTDLLTTVQTGFDHFYSPQKGPKIYLSLDEYNPGDLDINIKGLHLIGYVDPGFPNPSELNKENFRFMISAEHVTYGGRWAPDETDMKDLETDISSPTEAVKQLISHHFSGTIHSYFESRSWEPDPDGD